MHVTVLVCSRRFVLPSRLSPEQLSLEGLSNMPGEGSSRARAWDLQLLVLLLVQFCVLGACSAITKDVCLGLQKRMDSVQ